MPRRMRRCRGPEKEPSAAADDHHDSKNAQNHEKSLHAAARAHSNTVDRRQRDDYGNRRDLFRHRTVRKLAEIFSEGNRDGGRPASMNHENAYPAIEKTQERIVGLTDVSILSSDLGHAVGQFGVNKRPNKWRQPPGPPSAK